jgi:SAM-dependent methyltransferase
MKSYQHLQIGDSMKLIDLINRKPVPEPWAEGDNIPWNEPSFSERMLAEHLSQDHDAASRKFDRIDQHVYWLHNHMLSATPSRILDLGCGPGLYTNRLAKFGHQCVGIDYSPASIAYAQESAAIDKLDNKFLEVDIRDAVFGVDYDAVMLIYGELNVFKRTDARLILQKAIVALKSRGKLILEPHTFEAVRKWGERERSWYTSDGGLFSAKPHIVMEEFFWNQDLQATTNRYYIVDSSTGDVIFHSQSVQAYTHQDYESLLQECGYKDIIFYPSLTGTPDPTQPNLLAIIAQKP